MLIDIFLLRVMNAHEGFDGLDDALRISYEIAIGIPPRQPYEVEICRAAATTTARMGHSEMRQALWKELHRGGGKGTLTATDDRTLRCPLGVRYSRSCQVDIPMPTPDDVRIYSIRPTVISVLDYTKGFGHTDLVTY